jgi:drug/metabolite transporter (DMT)-like permease
VGPEASVSHRSFRDREDIHVIAAVTAVAAWGVGPILNVEMSVSTPSIVFYRMLLGLPVMIAMAYLNGGGLSRDILRRTSLPGVLFALSFITGFASIKLTSIANATLVTTLQPVLVLFVARKMFGERLTVQKLLYSATAMIGVLIVVMAAASSSGAQLSGDILAVSNVVIWTGYFVLAKVRRVDGMHSWSFLAGVFTWAALVVMPFGAVASNDLGAMTAKDWWCVIGMTLGPGVVGHGLMTWSQSHVDVSLASLLGLLSPVISAVLAWFLLGQHLTGMQLVGGAVVLASIGALVRAQNADLPEPAV